MKVTYEPIGVNNFHNSSSIDLIVSGEKTNGICYDGQVYRISKGQSKRIEDHFCGVTDCRCPHGAVDQLNEAGTEFGIPVKWCETK
jgi:hypothetical protein